MNRIYKAGVCAAKSSRSGARNLLEGSEREKKGPVD